MTREAAFRYGLLALALCAASVGLCIGYIDRPLALFLDAHVRHTELWVWLDVALRPFALAVAAAAIIVFACGLWLVSGHRLRPWIEAPLLCSWSAVLAGASAFVLKRVFGRGWPDPTFIHDHLYGFHFLHGEKYWSAFPSGTATVSVAILSVLWTLSPRWRAASALIVVWLVAAVVVTNYHWLSDVIAGGFLGASIGWLTVRWRHPFRRLIGGN